jgi:hypothetical protein
VRLNTEVEIAMKELDFEHAVIVKPGLIVGESLPIEAVFRSTAKILGAISGGIVKDGWAQDADVIAHAAVKAGLKADEGELKVWEVEQRVILRLGRSS